MRKKYKRAYIVNSKFQMRQLAAVFFGNLLIAVLMTCLLSFLFLVVWDKWFTIQYSTRVPIYMAICLVIVLFSTLLVSIRRSRKIAGQMLKLKMVLSDAAEGKIPEKGVKFRQGDFFHDLEEPLNDCLKKLCK